MMSFLVSSEGQFRDGHITKCCWSAGSLCLLLGRLYVHLHPFKEVVRREIPRRVLCHPLACR